MTLASPHAIPPLQAPTRPPVAQFDGGSVFIDGAYAHLSEAKISMFEGPGFDVFMKDGEVRTAAEGVLEGISRRTVIEACERLRMPLRLEPVPEADMRAADEVFLTSSGGGILPIARLDGQPLPHFAGPVTQRLCDVYWAMHDEAAHRDPVDYAE